MKEVEAPTGVFVFADVNHCPMEYVVVVAI
jgi:hypothetical protein